MAAPVPLATSHAVGGAIVEAVVIMRIVASARRRRRSRRSPDARSRARRTRPRTQCRCRPSVSSRAMHLMEDPASDAREVHVGHGAEEIRARAGSCPRSSMTASRARSVFACSASSAPRREDRGAARGPRGTPCRSSRSRSRGRGRRRSHLADLVFGQRREARGEPASANNCNRSEAGPRLRACTASRRGFRASAPRAPRRRSRKMEPSSRSFMRSVMMLAILAHTRAELEREAARRADIAGVIHVAADGDDRRPARSPACSA